MNQIVNAAICIGVLLVLVLVWMLARKLMFLIGAAFFAFAVYNNTQTLRVLRDLGVRWVSVHQTTQIAHHGPGRKLTRGKCVSALTIRPFNMFIKGEPHEPFRSQGNH